MLIHLPTSLRGLAESHAWIPLHKVIPGKHETSLCFTCTRVVNTQLLEILVKAPNLSLGGSCRGFVPQILLSTTSKKDIRTID